MVLMMQDPNIKKMLKSIAILLGMILIIALLAIIHRNNSMTLSEHALLSQDISSETNESTAADEATWADEATGTNESNNASENAD